MNSTGRIANQKNGKGKIIDNAMMKEHTGKLCTSRVGNHMLRADIVSGHEVSFHLGTFVCVPGEEHGRQIPTRTNFATMSATVSNHLSIKTTRFFMQIIGMWYPENKREELVSNFFLACAMVNLISASIILLTDLWFSLGDLAAVSYNAPCTTSTMQEFLKLGMFVYYRRNVMDFIVFTENTFWNIKYSRPDLDILENCNRTCLWAYGVSLFLMQSIPWSYATISIIENRGRNETDRELPFRVWFDLPLTTTPWFECAFVLEIAACCCVGTCSTTFAVFLFTINLYTAGQFKILQRKLEISSEICSNVLMNKTENNLEKVESLPFENLKGCIKQHQLLIEYIARVENLYCYIMLGQALGGVFQICFSSFQIVLGTEISVQRTSLSFVFLLGTTIQLFLFSWSCHMIIEQSLAVAESAYKASWYNVDCTENGTAFRRAILIMICRARKPCVLTVGKFTPMSLHTFASVFNTSISYFTVLRQMREDQS